MKYNNDMERAEEVERNPMPPVKKVRHRHHGTVANNARNNKFETIPERMATGGVGFEVFDRGDYNDMNVCVEFVDQSNVQPFGKENKTINNTHYDESDPYHVQGPSSSGSDADESFGYGCYEKLPMGGKDFLKWRGLGNPETFLDIPSHELWRDLARWREDKGLNEMNQARGVSIIDLWKDDVSKRLQESINDSDGKSRKRPRCGEARPAGSQGSSLQPNGRPSHGSHDTDSDNASFIGNILDKLPRYFTAFLASCQITEPNQFLNTSSKHLGSRYNAWRKSRNMNPLGDPRRTINTWKDKVRKKLSEAAVAAKNSSVPPPEATKVKMGPVAFSDSLMPLVTTLSKRYVNEETGLPIYEFAVRRMDSDAVIYFFRVDTGRSWIPNAGNGAFLTYVGARVLKESAARKSPTKKDSGTKKIIKPLVALDADDIHFTVNITGDGLYDCLPKVGPPVVTALPPLYSNPPPTTGVSLKEITAVKLDGLLGDYTLDDYVEDPEMEFSSLGPGCASIRLSRYSPFLPGDRKCQTTFDIKNFIFSSEPSEWGFEVEENFRGKTQITDITDDKTGMPHDVAKRNIAMYVNETGGDEELKQTVRAVNVDKQEIYYDFFTDVSMKKGEQIELLICYKESYTDVRERKGYGKRDTDHLSDDHFPTYMEREFAERFNMIEEVYNHIDYAMELYDFTYFLLKIRRELGEILDKFVEHLKTSIPAEEIPYAAQISALRRLEFLKPYVNRKIEHMELHVSCPHGVFQQCKENVSMLEWDSWPVLIDLFDANQDLVDANGYNLREKLRAEITVEICYHISQDLFFPCNEDTWCGLASTLTQDLCVLVARREWDCTANNGHSRLGELFLQRAANAAAQIHSPHSLDCLLLSRDCWKRYRLENRAAIKDDAEEEYEGEKKLSHRAIQGTKCLLTVAESAESPEDRAPEPVIVNEQSSETHNLLSKVHKNWYLSRQIIYVVKAFAKKYLSEDASYSFERLCEMIGISVGVANHYLLEEIGVATKSKFRPRGNYYYGEHFDQYRKGNKLSVAKVEEASSLPRERKPSLHKSVFWHIVWPRLKVLGWTMDTGTRPTDFYFCPPGVQRGREYHTKNRVDYFDSFALVVNCLETDERYCSLPQIKSIVRQYKKCQVEVENLRAMGNRAPKFASKDCLLAYLEAKLDESNDEETDTEEVGDCEQAISSIV